MANLNLTHSGNMNITSASIGPGGTLDVQYEPNDTGYITGWTTDPVSGLDDYDYDETLTVRFTPQFSGTVLSETFVVSGYDEAGIRRSDTSVLRQGYDTDVRHYLGTTGSGSFGGLFFPAACVINSSAATANYIDVNITVTTSPSSTSPNFVLMLIGSGINKRRGFTFNGYIETPTPTAVTWLEVVVPDEVIDYGQASAYYEPSSATVNLVYSLENNDGEATIDPVTGEITVLRNGEVWVCVVDTISNLSSCKPVTLNKSDVVPLERISIYTECLIVDSGYPEVVLYPENATVHLRYWVSEVDRPVTEEISQYVTINERTGEMTVLQTGQAIVSVEDELSGRNVGMLTSFAKSTPTPATATPITDLTITTDRIVDSGYISTSYYPQNADVSFRYFSNTHSFTSVDENTGEATVLRTGGANIVVYDEISHLYDCKSIVGIDSDNPYDTGTTIRDLDLVVDDEIIENGVAVPVYSPDYAYVDLSFSSSDTNLATIDSNGYITVLDNGTVTFCVRDEVSGLQSCKTVAVKKAVYIDWIEIVVNDVVAIGGYASANYSPTAGTVSLVYTSSDPDIASIDPDTGQIVVYEPGEVTFCVRDLLTNKTDCKTVSVVGPEELLAVTYNVTSTTQSTAVIDWLYDADYMRQMFDVVYYNGESVDVANLRSFVFPETGEQTIYYKMKTTSLTVDGNTYVSPAFCVFNNLATIVKVKLPNDWEVLSQSSNVGYFENDTNLREIDCRYIKAIVCYAFANTKIKTLYFPLLEILGDDALNHTKIENITLPATVRKADLTQYDNHTNLRNVTLEGDYPVSGLTIAEGVHSENLYNVWVPCQYLSNYKSRCRSEIVPKVRCAENTTAITVSLVYTATGTTALRVINGPLRGSNPAVISVTDTQGNPFVVEQIYGTSGDFGWHTFTATGDTTVNMTFDLGYLQENGFGNLFGGTIIKSVDFRGDEWGGVGADGLMFSGCTELEFVAFPEGTTEIADGMFYAYPGCWKLHTVIIPDGVTNIGTNAFRGCRVLSNFTIPTGVTSIGDAAFEDCFVLTGNVNLPNIRTIGAEAFVTNNFTSIDVGSSIRSIGNEAFDNANIQQVIIRSVTPPSATVSGSDNIFGENRTYPVYLRGDKFFSYFPWTDVSAMRRRYRPLNAPTETRMVCRLYSSYRTTVKLVNDSALSCFTKAELADGTPVNMSSYTPPRTGTTNVYFTLANPEIVGNGTQNIILPNTGNTRLETVFIPNSVKQISSNSFYRPGLRDVSIGTGVTAIDNNCFYHSGTSDPLTNYWFFTETPPTLGTNAIRPTSNMVLFYPCGSDYSSYGFTSTRCFDL